MYYLYEVWKKGNVMQRKCRSCGSVFTVGGECQDRCKSCIDGVPKEGRMVLGYTPPPKEVEEIEEQPIEVEEEYTPPKYWNTCVECGKFFGTNNKKCILCSEECRKIRNRRNSANNWRKNKNKREQTKKCEYCGKQFTTYRANQRYCTTECNNRGRKHKIRSSIDES